MFKYDNCQIINGKKNSRLTLTLINGSKRICHTIFNENITQEEMNLHALNLIEQLNSDIEIIEDEE
jgi:hypothetical protein